jgi:hypothetical protein
MEGNIMSSIETHFEVVITNLNEDGANWAALQISNQGFVGVEVREVAE